MSSPSSESEGESTSESETESETETESTSKSESRSTADAYDLRERIDAVSAAETDTDRLLTFAVSVDEPLERARERIQQEHASAEYIDSGEASTHVTDALERVRRTLHEYEELPENGLVIYAGVIDGELTDFVFDDLPAPVEDSSFDQANEFDTDPLEGATDRSATYGLLVVERGGAALGRLEGEDLVVEETYESNVAGKTRAGGQSEGRFERERERQKEAFFDDVADAAARTFLADPSATEASPEAEERAEGGASAGEAGEADEERGNGAKIDALLVGGTTVSAETFLEGDYLDHRLEELVEGPFAVEYASEQGLQQLVERGQEQIEAQGRQRAREALERFFTGLQDDEQDVTYGREDVDRALEFDAVETLLLADSLALEERQELAERATNAGGEVVDVSTDLEEGRRLDEGFGGVAALLRFPIE